MSRGVAAPSDADTSLARFILDLRSHGLRDATLLGAFEKTDRSVFIPRLPAGVLYQPIALPIECGQEATSPQAIARIVGALDLKPGMKVLEIGTGSGYQSAILARIGCRVVTVERFRTLHLAAGRALARQQVVNLRLEHGDGTQGFEAEAPYDRIVVACALKEVPDALIEQVAPGGSIVIPIVHGRDQRLYVFDDMGETWRQRDQGRCAYSSAATGVALAL